MPPTARRDYDLYFDESGTFADTSTDPDERAAATQKFPSQLGGLLAPRGTIYPGAAEEVLAAAFAAAGLDYDGRSHGKDLRAGAGYDALVETLVAELAARGWQPVRMVNRERVSFGDRVTTYTAVTAEWVVRLCELKHAFGEKEVAVHLYPAKVWLPEQAAHIADSEYLARVNEYRAFVAVRRGRARDSAGWEVTGATVRHDEHSPALQICDLICDASRDRYKKPGRAARDALKALVGPFDLTLAVRDPVVQLDGYLVDQQYGLAVLRLAELAADEGTAKAMAADLETRRAAAVKGLAELPVSLRGGQLGLVAGWAEQVVDGVRDLALGTRVCRWLQKQIGRPLTDALAGGPDAGTADGFRYALHLRALTAHNHRGALAEAQEEAAALAGLAPGLARSWEHAPLLVQGIAAEAVHLTDCFDHPAALARLIAARGFYEALDGLFHAALPDVFPERVRSEARARVLGTLVQAEVFAGLDDPERAAAARAASDAAVAEFEGEGDRRRQYQYRCHLEAVAGDLPAARQYLARGLGLGDDSWAAVGGFFAGLDRAGLLAQRFSVLHALRVGVRGVETDPAGEGAAFRAAVDHTGLAAVGWSAADAREYPAHGVLRRLAHLAAGRGDRDAALSLLRQLAECIPAGGVPVPLVCVQLASTAEASLALRPHDPPAAARLLTGDAKAPGLPARLAVLRRATEAAFPKVWALFADWDRLAPAAADGDPSATAELRVCCGRIGY